MTAITDLYARVVYDSSKTDMPILVVMHGFSDGVADFPLVDLERFAASGFFAVAVGMRGRDGASGSQDAGGREIYDIYDAVVQVRSTYSSYVSATKAAIVGYSGGGGNALGVACKFPDFWVTIVDYFGISDYGRDATDGWYQNRPTIQATIAAWVGGTPVGKPNNYYARDTTAAIQNFTGGQIYTYHDDQDVSVGVVQTTNIGDALDAASMTNYTESVTSTASNPRWFHGYPNNYAGQWATGELTWMANIKSASAWTVAASGTVTVIGYIVTKRFTIWLRANGSTVYGLDAAATVVYNTATDTYTVTPLTGAIDVTITQGAKTGSATNITEETEIVVT